MKPPTILLSAVCLLPAVAAWSQPASPDPHLGYLYPAGCRDGSTVLVTAGGQALRGVSGVHVSGDGVRARVVKYFPPVFNIDPEQRRELQTRLLAAWRNQVSRLPGGGRGLMPPALRRSSMTMAEGSPAPPATGGAPPFEHPLLWGLEDKDLRELQHIIYNLRFPRSKRQLNLQIGETVLVEIDVERGVEPGDRELRLITPLGLTNPMTFQVGGVEEYRELEPNDPGVERRLPPPTPSELPVVFNGQVLPGDVDRFSFRAEAGQWLVIEARARRLIPYLADAVPGWFQATMALYDSNGDEIAFDDDYRFDPDPVLFFEVPATGVYQLEIRDAVYRGREDFVYRIAVGEQPFVTETFPLGGPAGGLTIATVSGWNLRDERLRLDTRPAEDHLRRAVLTGGGLASNPVFYSVDSLPECGEVEPNDTAREAQPIGLPRIINGRIDRPDDVDVFQIEGRAGDELVVEVTARRLLSPLDSLVRVTNAGGEVLEWNDDFSDPGSGWLTHHADSYVMMRLPTDGRYRVYLSDAQRHGGGAYAYRLRLGRPSPDFELRVTPSSINVPMGGSAPITVHALRKDGFEGEIEVVLADAPSSFQLRGGVIPAGCDRVRMTLSAGWRPRSGTAVLSIEGRALIAGRRVVRPAVPAEDMTQAFVYSHLVPSLELMAAVRRRPPGLPATVAGAGRLRIPIDGSARVEARLPRHPKLREVEYELRDPPEGVSLDGARLTGTGLVLEFGADGDLTQEGLRDNLIVEAFVEVENPAAGVGDQGRTRRVSLGVLPAIPCEIVGR